jgi:hypothetical protein
VKPPKPPKLLPKSRVAKIRLPLPKQNMTLTPALPVHFYGSVQKDYAWVEQ